MRNLQAVVDDYPGMFWPRAMQALFQTAIHLHHQRNDIPPEQFLDQFARIVRACDRLLQRSLSPPEPDVYKNAT